MKMTLFLFGLCVGLWGSTWVAAVHPLLPFLLSYPVGGWVLWRVAAGRAHRRA